MKKVVLFLFTGLFLTSAASAGQVTIGYWDFAALPCYTEINCDWGFEAVPEPGVEINVMMCDEGQFILTYTGEGIIHISMFNCHLGGTDGAAFDVDVPDDIFNHYLWEVVVQMPTTLCDYCPLPDGQEIYLSDDEMDFGDVAVNETAAMDLLIHNLGNADLEVTDISSDNPAFTHDWSDTRTTVPFGSPLTVTVTFAPAELTDYNGTLTITSDDADEPALTVDLSGVGVPLPVPDINLSAYTHNFGEVIVGETLDWDLIIYNVGTGDLDILDIQSANEYFTVDYEDVRTIIPPDDSLTVTVTFVPTEVQSYNGTLMILSDDPDESVVGVGLQGVGISDNEPPTLELPDDFTFDENMTLEVDFSLYADDPDPEDMLTLTSDGGTNIFVEIDGLNVTFSATYGWFGEETLNFTVEDLDGATATDDVLVIVNDVAYPDIMLGVESWDFGSVRIGIVAEFLLSVANLGDGDLELTEINTDNEVFYTHFTDPITLAQYETTNITIYFAPTEEIMYDGTLTIVSNDPDGDATVTLYGEGWMALPPEPFSLLEPADGGTLEPPVTFSWEETTDPDPGDVVSYRFYLYGDEELTDTLMMVPLNVTSYNLMTLEADGEYWWNVRAMDTNTGGTLSTETWSFIWVESVGVPEGLPEEFAISSIYPNPFNPEVTVVFGVAQPAEIKADIYDMSGRLIAQLTPGYLQSGYHSFTWRPMSTTATGIYFLQMSSDSGWRETKRLIYLK